MFLPLLAWMGLTPARAAKAASLRKRPGPDHDTQHWAAVMTPTPSLAALHLSAPLSDSQILRDCESRSKEKKALALFERMFQLRRVVGRLGGQSQGLSVPGALSLTFAQVRGG
ncbi:hypothetical protein GCM10010404_58250 [Nonomuraea africana]